MNINGFGTSVQQLPYRQSMHGNAKAVQDATIKYMEDQVNANNAVFVTGMRVIRAASDGNERVKQVVIGVINYVDYLLNFAKMAPQDALKTGIEVCVNGFIANIVLRSHGNEIDQQLRYQLTNAEQQLGTAIQLVNQSIVPEITREQQGGFGTSNAFSGAQPRRQDNQFSNPQGAGGLNVLGGGSGNSGGTSLFSSTAPATNSQGGGMVLGMGSNETVSNFQGNNQTQAFQQPTQPTQQPAVKPANNNTVTYMDYAQHKTFGLLKKTLPSDSSRQLMSQLTLENNFSAMAAVSDYTKIQSGELQRKDLVLAPGAGYALETITLAYGSTEVSSLVNETAGEILQLNRKELERLTFSGLIIQCFPEYMEEEVIDRLLRTYTTGMITHGRLTAMMEELETLVRPETMLIISRKLTQLATDYWRYSMDQLDGGLENYFLDHDDVTEYLRREPGKEALARVWAEFPAHMLNEFFLKVPLTSEDGMAHTFGFHASFVRVPYYAAELPIGVNSDESKGFGIVSRNVTPGLYNLCKTIFESNPGALHRLIMTNDGRLVNVTQSKVEAKDLYYIHEVKTLL